MSEEKIQVCESQDLDEGGKGVRFFVKTPNDGEMPAFAIRIEGKVKAYLNRCSHIPVEMDWPEGQFFEDSGLYIVCATHGAMYSAEDGRCVGGPCRGQGLSALNIEETDGKVLCLAVFK
jgi:nitrite reductase/ring-hydroxylating ferredoxin subunit